MFKEGQILFSGMLINFGIMFFFLLCMFFRGGINFLATAHITCLCAKNFAIQIRRFVEQGFAMVEGGKSLQ